VFMHGVRFNKRAMAYLDIYHPACVSNTAECYHDFCELSWITVVFSGGTFHYTLCL
jgi:hypothetical protein